MLRLTRREKTWMDSEMVVFRPRSIGIHFPQAAQNCLAEDQRKERGTVGRKQVGGTKAGTWKKEV